MPNPLNFPGWYVERWEQNTYDYRFTELVMCPACGSTHLSKHGILTPEFRDVPMHGKRVGLLVQRQRYRCQQYRCTCVDPMPGLDNQRRVTERLKLFVSQQVLTHPFTAVATEVGLNEKTVRAVFREAVNAWNRTRTLATPTILGIDEVVLGQPRCVLTNVGEQTLLDILPHRTYEQVLAYLTHLPQAHQVQWVTMDMWRPYRDAVHRALPHVTIVVDKFHVLRMANAALDTVRKQVRTSLSPTQRRTLMHDRFLLLRRAHELAPMDQVLVETWTKNLPLLGQAYHAKEAFFAVYETSAPQEAEYR